MSKINHAPKCYVRFASGKVNFPDNFQVYKGSIYGRFSNAAGMPIFWVCDNYALVEGRLPVHIYNNGIWKLSFVEPSHPCYKWVKEAIEKMGKVPSIEKRFVSGRDIKALMHQEPRHKKGNGSRINTHQINQPLRWNEVTELAHWNGKGNASVVACNIR
jgi:hypothetical protein